MYVVEVMIGHLKKQIELAPSLTENTDPGANFTPKYQGDMVETIVDKLKEGMNRAEHIPVLRGVESGFRRYSTAFQKCLPHAEAVAAIFAQVQNLRGQMYLSGEAREQALRPYQAKGAEIVTHCKAMLACMEEALNILNEGESKDAKAAEKLGPVHTAKGEESAPRKRQAVAAE